MQLDPKDRTRLDALIESTERERSRRHWRIWLVVALASLGLLISAQIDLLPPYLQLAMVIAACVGLLLFLVFLSTKPYGHWDTSWFWWWWW